MTDIDKVMEALLQPSSTEEETYKDDAECGFVNCDPDEEDEDEYEYDEDEYDEDEYDTDSEYDDWVANTYSGYDLSSVVRGLISKLEGVKNRLEDDEMRYRGEDYATLEDMIDEARNAVDRVVSASEDYEVFD